MQHDPGYEHWQERVSALEQMVDQHSLDIESLEIEIIRVREAVLELINIMKEEEVRNDAL